MKKFFVRMVVLMLLVCFSLSMQGSKAVESENYESNPDNLLMDTIEDFTDDSSALTFKQKPLYTPALTECGKVYQFFYDDSEGYAILTRINGRYQVSEIYFDSPSPYSNTDGKCIYAGLMNYLCFENGSILDIFTKIHKPESEYFAGSTLDRSETVDAYYSSKTDRSGGISSGIPAYTFSSNGNGCANIAGGIVLGYYDQRYSNLIPNFTPNEVSQGVNHFKSQTPEVTAVIDDLGVRMNTNVGQAGTTYNNFRNGLTSYVQSRNRTIAYTNVATYGFNFSDYKNQINNNRPVVMFFDTYNIMSIFFQKDGYDRLVTNYFKGSHIMVGYGYREVSYNRQESVSVWSPVWYNPFRFVVKTQTVNFRNDTYLKVSTTMSGALSQGYVRLDDQAVIDYAIAVNIY